MINTYISTGIKHRLFADYKGVEWERNTRRNRLVARCADAVVSTPFCNYPHVDMITCLVLLRAAPYHCTEDELRHPPQRFRVMRDFTFAGKLYKQGDDHPFRRQQASAMIRESFV